MRKPKTRTYDDVERAQRRAVTGLLNLGRDEDADDIEGLSVESYAERKGWEIKPVFNSRTNRRKAMGDSTWTKQELLDYVGDVEDLFSDILDGNVTYDDVFGRVQDLVEPDGDDDDSDDDGDDDDGDQ